MKTKTTIQTLHVKGTLWNGSGAEHSYSLRNLIPNDLNTAKTYAGDFSEVTHATIVTTQRTVEEKITREKRTVEEKITREKLK
jgi:hypothetical protein